MARIPEAEIERLKEAVPVARLVEASGVELKKGGKDLLGRCPFHEDATASLVVSNQWDGLPHPITASTCQSGSVIEHSNRKGRPAAGGQN